MFEASPPTDQNAATSNSKRLYRTSDVVWP